MRFLILICLGLVAGTPAMAGEFICAPKTFETSETVPPRLSVEEMRSEIDCMVDILRHVHPNLEVYTGRAEFERLARAVRDGFTGPMTVEEAHGRYLELVAAVCDEHTTVNLPPELFRTWPYGRHGFGLPLYVVGETLYGALPGHGTARRAGEPEERIVEIAAVNGMPAAEVRDFILSHTVIDGCADNREFVPTTYMMQRYLTGLFGADAPYRVEIRPAGRPARTVRVAGSPPWELARTFGRRQGTLDVPMASHGFEARVAAGNWRYLLNREDGVGYLYAGDFQRIEEGEIRMVMGEVIADAPRSLIVDLSNNPGGLVGKSMLLNSFLIPRAHRPADYALARRYSVYRPTDLTWEADGKKQRRLLYEFRRGRQVGGVRKLPLRIEGFGNPSYRGRLYVLVSQRTGSAAVASTFVLKRYRDDTTIIGASTHGGGKWGCTSPRGYYTLPYSQMRLYVPQTCHQRTGELAERWERAIVPDVPVMPAIDRLDDFGAALIEAALAEVSRNTVARAD